MSFDWDAAVDAYAHLSVTYGEAKRVMISLDHIRKAIRAELMSSRPDRAYNAQLRDALCHPDYLQACEEYATAVGKEAELRHALKAYELRFEMWRTESATRRAEMNLAR